MKDFFKFGGKLSSQQSFLISIIGFISIISLWQIGCIVSGVSSTILPSPLDIIKSFGKLYNDYNLMTNIW